LRLQRQLNIDNTFRVLNLNFYDKKRDYVKVNAKNKEKVLACLNDNQEHYYVIDGTSDDLLLNHKVYKSQDHIIYATNDLIPMSVFLAIGSNRKVIYMYRLHNFSQAELDNMNTASEVGTTAIYVPNITEDTRITPLLFDIEDARFIADRIYLEFNDDATQDLKEAYFDTLHEILARWTIQLYLSYSSEAEHQKLSKYLIKKYK
jgi:hypothetical protein